MNYFYGFLAILLVSVIALIWIFAVWYPMAKLKKVLVCFMAFSVGILLWDAFLHLLPEAVEEYWFNATISWWIIWWIFIWFIIEKILTVKRANKENEVKTFAWMNLVWDMVHNSIDWIIIWSAFIVDVHLWIATTLAVILHEIPQEIGDFCVLVHGWMERKKALLYNFLTALTAFIGLWIAYLLDMYVEWISQVLMPISAWLFIYIAASDMVPELHNESNLKHSIFLAIWFVVMYWLTLTEWEEHHHGHDEDHDHHSEIYAELK